MLGIPLFDTLVILYLFLGGAAAGALFIIAAWSIVFHRRIKERHIRLQTAFKSLMSYCYVTGMILLSFSILCLLWDLGQPQRALSLFFRPHLTVLTFGSYSLLFEVLIVAFLIAANRLDLFSISGRVRKVLEYLCCVGSSAVMIYTGVFLATNISVPFWNTWTLIALFFFSSLSAGVSLVLLIDYFVKDRTLLLRAARPLQKIHVCVLLLEAAAMAGFIAVAFFNQETSKSIEILLGAEMLPTAIIGVVGMGVIIPLILESYNLLTKPYRTIPVSDVICLLGGLCLRYVIIQCGVH